MLEGFSIIDTNGYIKVSPAGSGTTLSNPVTPTHGGTGLTSSATGDLLYASATNTFGKLVTDSTTYRILTNNGSAGFDIPMWSDPATALTVVPKPTLRKLAFLTTGANGMIGTGGVFAGTSGTLTVDATASWKRFTSSGAAGNAVGYTANPSTGWTWIEHLPRVDAIVRTGSDITSIRYFFFLSSNGSTLITNADDQHLLKGIGIRYSTVAVDGGVGTPQFVPWTSDGTTQVIGTPIAAIAASTVYTVSLVVTSTTSATISVGNSSQVVAIPAGALSAALSVQLNITNVIASSRFFDLAQVYGEWNA
jgi:hypothetical protein